MARIPEEEIERLKSEVSLVRLMEAAGMELRRSGKDWACRCPFHANDNEPSLIVSTEKNLFHCFACGAAGSVIDWVMKSQGVSFRHAVELLKDDVAVTVNAPVHKSTVRQLDAPLAFDADDQALLNQVIDYYHATLKQSPEALAYLESRGIADSAAIDTFILGVANRTLGLRLPEKTRVAGADIRHRLQRIGLYRASGHEHFNGSLVIPVLDGVGNVQEVYGRKIAPANKLTVGTPLHLYLPGPHRGVWNAEALAASKEIILTESLIDALTFWCAGYRNVTASYGVEGFTDDHFAAFKRHGTERVLIAYDRDNAGDAAADKLATRLMAEGIECFRIPFPQGMDANEYAVHGGTRAAGGRMPGAAALKVQPASKSLGVVIRKAIWLGKGPPPPVAAPCLPPVLTAPADGVAVLAEEAVPFLAAGQDALMARAVAPGILPPATLMHPCMTHGCAGAAASDEPLPASPMPTTARSDAVLEVHGKDRCLILGERRYRVRGLEKNLAVDVLKVNLMVSVGDAFYVDTLDLYAAKQRHAYSVQAKPEVGVDERVLKNDLGRLVLALEQAQDKTIGETLQAAPAPAMEKAEQDAALALLRDPKLIERILADFEVCGLIGERTNKLVGYLAAISRKLDRPLGVVIQSSSAAGKTTVLDAVLSFVPEEEKVKYSAMTGQSLFYMGETNLKHKALAIVEEEGASRASYALKLLQSEGELTIASTGKDPATGNLITQEYRVEGPVALLLTTTARDLDEELLNRCLVLAVDESRDQTRAIHQLQRDRRTLDGMMAKHERQAIRALHQNAQRLLRPLEVLNPYARFLTFPDQTTRLRRDNEKYLTLIDTIAFLRQYQREVKTQRQGEHAIETIEVTLADIALAHELAHDVLGRSLDELPPQTRRLLTAIDDYVRSHCASSQINKSDYRFSRRALREAIAWGDTQLRVHLERLVELEYLIPHREGAGGKYVYALAYEVSAQPDRAQVAGLVDVAALEDLVANATMPKSRGETPEVAGRLRGECGPNAGRLRGEEIPGNARVDAGSASLAASAAETALIQAVRKAVLRRSRHSGAADERAEGTADAGRQPVARVR